MINQTKNISGLRNGTIFQVNLTDNSNYEWNCLVYDKDGNYNWSSSNYTFKINSSYNALPQIILQYPPHNEPNIKLDPTLNVTVIDPEGTNMNVTFYGREKNNTNFTIIAIPDTQHYVWSTGNPEIFTNQTRWIRDNRVKENIVFVSHEGDIVETPQSATEWQRANTSMSVLDDNNIPYGVLPGNHDKDPCCTFPEGNTNNYNTYFPVSRFSSEPWWGGNYDRNDNNYHFFSAGGDNYIIMHLEYGANNTILDWANQTLHTYANKSAIVVTHDYLDDNGQRTIPHGQRIWDRLIAPSPNVFLVLAGHVHTNDGQAVRSDVVNGRTIHTVVWQILADYQEYPNGGDGWLRIMRFVPSKKRVEVRTYSPWRNEFNTSVASQFNFTYNIPLREIGKDLNVVNGTNATFLWKNLNASTTYEWNVEVMEGDNVKTISPVWNFTTGTE